MFVCEGRKEASAYVPWFQETRVVLILEMVGRSILNPNRFVKEAVEVNEGPARNRHESGSESRKVELLWRNRVVGCLDAEEGGAGHGSRVYIPRKQQASRIARTMAGLMDLSGIQTMRSSIYAAKVLDSTCA
jgi:hypothetical protein